MTTRILITCITLFTFLSASKCQKANSDDIIVWKAGMNLTWKDFKGKPDKNDTIYDARTFTQIYLEYEENDHSIEFDIPCYFYKNSSWSKSKSKRQESISLLKHEQLHFDITELMARRIRKEFSEYKSYNLSSTYYELKKLYDHFDNDERLRINTSYDEQTAHGTIIEKQKEWEKKIENELYKLRKYEDTKVKVRRITVVNN